MRGRAESGRVRQSAKGAYRHLITGDGSQRFLDGVRIYTGDTILTCGRGRPWALWAPVCLEGDCSIHLSWYTASFRSVLINYLRRLRTLNNEVQLCTHLQPPEIDPHILRYAAEQQARQQALDRQQTEQERRYNSDYESDFYPESDNDDMDETDEERPAATATTRQKRVRNIPRCR
jgi:hypothetical protein